jgi:hydrogenase maturation protein HypF
MVPAPGSEVAVASCRRLRIRVEGIVQGVGFRPYLYQLAQRLGLAGHALNDGRGVLVEVEGAPAGVAEFLARLEAEAPPLAVIERVAVEEVATSVRDSELCIRNSTGASRGEAQSPGTKEFVILKSDDTGPATALVAADVATCGACLSELFDPADRRYRYPFINCTHCGPRFTIIRGTPYDRSLTTMAGFAMCARCRGEYEDPGNRRFHAQPNACPECGPRVWVVDGERAGAGGRAYIGELAGAGDHVSVDSAGIVEAAHPADPILASAAALRAGAIVAIKGLGGFHLACLAREPAAVRALRERKRRPAKPFALMVPDLAGARRLVRLDEAEEALLCSRERPIVLAPRRAGATVAPGVAPGQRDLGVMLPYTPLHHLLLVEIGEALVMTSGNLSDEPIAYRNEAALARLAGIADYFLLHDRPILLGVDDSVARVVTLAGERCPQLIRRSRGYAPRPLPLPIPATRPVLACGAQLKNTFCLARGERAWPSHHIGDLGDFETLRAFDDGVAHLEALCDLRPESIALDLHPEYLATKYAVDRVAQVTTALEPFGIQHHHAHLAACLAEHGELGPALGVIFDGTGYGPDGTVWGGEVLLGDLVDYERVAHLHQVRLPGGEAAIREPWRMACAWMIEAGERTAAAGEGTDARHELLDGSTHGAVGLGGSSSAFVPPLPATLAGIVAPARWAAVARLARSGLVAPLTSSVGRLFDAVAALCGLGAVTTYEGEAAITFEAALDPAEAGWYEIPISGGGPPAAASLSRPDGSVSVDAPVARGNEKSICGNDKSTRTDEESIRVDGESVRGGEKLIRVDGQSTRGDEDAFRGAGPLTLDPRPLIRTVLAELESGVPVGIIAARFHNSLARATALLCARLAERYGVRLVVLSGGVYQNRELLERSAAELARAGLRVLVPARIPPNDGGIAYGQAAIVAARSAARGWPSAEHAGPAGCIPRPGGP